MERRSTIKLQINTNKAEKIPQLEKMKKKTARKNKKFLFSATTAGQRVYAPYRATHLSRTISTFTIFSLFALQNNYKRGVFVYM